MVHGQKWICGDRQGVNDVNPHGECILPGAYTEKVLLSS